MGWVFCEKHRRQGLVITSPKFVAAAKRKEFVDPADIRYINIHSDGRMTRNPVDRAFFEKLGFPVEHFFVILHDRDKIAMQLNDRILVLKIKKEMAGICSDCLDAVLPPAHRLTVLD